MPSSEQLRAVAQERSATPPEQPTAMFEAKQPGTIAAPLGGNALDDGLGAPDRLQPGQLLGQYRILEHLGAGGMGQVYKAVHAAMDRVVALKVIAPHFLENASVRARFQREVRNAARLLHPNVVVAHDAAEVNGLWFLVMEYVEGRDLASLLSRHGRPPLGLACEIVRQSAVGLQYAHEMGMVHRDIKPANLMVASSRPRAAGATLKDGWLAPPLVKILDFGLSRLTVADGEGFAHADDVTREGGMVGTPEFIAPEQARDSRLVDIRSDIYSLGCTLYTLLAGRPPFRAGSSFEVVAMHLRQAPEPIASYCPGIPLELSAVVHRMLAKEPRERFQTPGEVSLALQPWAQFAAAPTPVPDMENRPAYVFSLVPVTPAAPVPPARPIASPPRAGETIVPMRVIGLHFQAVLRTIFLMIVVIFLVVGCVAYLPEIGQFALDFIHRVVPAGGVKAPAPKR